MTTVSTQLSSEAQQFERRRSTRYRLELILQVWPDIEQPPGLSIPPSDGHPTRAILANLSFSGVSFLVERPYPIGTSLWFRLKLGRFTHYVKGRVRSIALHRSSGGRCYRCGLQFVRCQQTSRFVSAIVAYLRRQGRG